MSIRIEELDRIRYRRKNLVECPGQLPNELCQCLCLIDRGPPFDCFFQQVPEFRKFSDGSPPIRVIFF